MNTVQSAPAFTLSANEILADKISELAAHIHAATYRFLVLVREFDEREAWAEMGANTCAHWLNWRCGISVHTAREKVRVAHALAGLPSISLAFERGELSYSKVRAVTRVASDANEEMLLNIALSGTASQLERVVRCEIRCEREREIEARTDAAFENRAFSWKKCSDGTVEFFGRLPAELAEHVIKAVEANLLDAIRPEASDVVDESPTTEDSTNTVKGVVQTLRKNVPAGTSGESVEPKPSLASRRADALVALCSANCEGYEVTLHVPAGDSPRANVLGECGTIPMELAGAYPTL